MIQMLIAIALSVIPHTACVRARGSPRSDTIPRMSPTAGAKKVHPANTEQIPSTRLAVPFAVDIAGSDGVAVADAETVVDMTSTLWRGPVDGHPSEVPGSYSQRMIVRLLRALVEEQQFER